MLARNRSFVVAGAVGAAILTAASAPSPLYPVYQRLWGFSAFTLTVVFAAYVFALLAALLTVGALSDQVGRRLVACASLLVLAIGMLLFSVSGDVRDLVAARVVQGLAVGGAAGTTTAMISDTAPSPRLGAIVASAAPSLGIVIGSVLAGTLVEFAARPRQLVFWALGLAYLVLAALVWSVPERGRSTSSGRGPIWRSLLPTVGLPPAVRPAFVALLPSIGATWALAGLYLSLGSSVLRAILDVHSSFIVGLVLGAFFAAGAVGTVASTTLRSKQSEWFGYGALCLGVPITIAALPIGDLGLYAIGSIVAGLGFGTAFRFVVDALGEAAPVADRGQVFATMYIVSYLAFSVPALAAGLAVNQFGLEPTAVSYGVLEVSVILVAIATGIVREGRQVRGDEPGPSTATELTSRTFTSHRHTTRYLESGPQDGPLMIFLHGWPAIGRMWRHQMDTFAADGWRCIAPDLRGYGGSSAPAACDAYTVEEIVADMAELHDHLGGRSAIWVGHDWGSVVVGALTAHEPERSRGVVLTSWAYLPGATSLASLVELVDRKIYPADEHPDGQWDYFHYYTTHFDEAVADLDADLAGTLASVYRSGSPTAVGQISPTAVITREGGRFGAAHRAPPTPPDPALWPPADFDALVEAFEAHGFRPPCAWYTNDDANIAYARKAPRGGRLTQPVLFVNGEWDPICSITGNRQGEPMREACADLTVVHVDAGHWLPLERKVEHVRAIRTWLRTSGLAP